MASSAGGSGEIGCSLAGASPKGRSGRQTKSGASWSEGSIAGEHVPDRVSDTAGDVDLGHLGAALLSRAGASFAGSARRRRGALFGLAREGHVTAKGHY